MGSTYILGKDQVTVGAVPLDANIDLLKVPNLSILWL